MGCEDSMEIDTRNLLAAPLLYTSRISTIITTDTNFSRSYSVPFAESSVENSTSAQHLYI